MQSIYLPANNISKAIFSIKPKYVSQIIDGTKKYEFRKCKLARPVDTIIIYATAPISKIIGEFHVSEILVDSPNVIWNKTQFYSGLNEDEFFSYFCNCKRAIAYEIQEVMIYPVCKELLDLGIKYIPQSFAYID